MKYQQLTDVERHLISGLKEQDSYQADITRVEASLYP